jgi:hypothetical protein
MARIEAKPVFPEGLMREPTTSHELTHLLQAWGDRDEERRINWRRCPLKLTIVD